MKKFGFVDIVFMISVIVLIAVVQWFLIHNGGLETLIVTIIILMMVEMFFTRSIYLEDPASIPWIGLGLHVLGFLTTLIISLCEGEWGRNFEYEMERGHGIFSSEVSPAYLWWVLLGLLMIRVALQPLLLLKKK